MERQSWYSRMASRQAASQGSGWDGVRDHRGRDGDVQLILWPRVFVRCRRVLGNQVILAKGAVSRWDGTANVIVSHVERIDARVPMPTAHDWH